MTKERIPTEWKGSVRLGKLPEPLQWTAHNLIAHPLGEVVYLTSIVFYKVFGKGKRLYDFHNWLHDRTIPYNKPDTPCI